MLGAAADAHSDAALPDELRVSVANLTERLHALEAALKPLLSAPADVQVPALLWPCAARDDASLRPARDNGRWPTRWSARSCRRRWRTRPRRSSPVRRLHGGGCVLGAHARPAAEAQPACLTCSLAQVPRRGRGGQPGSTQRDGAQQQPRMLCLCLLTDCRYATLQERVNRYTRRVAHAVDASRPRSLTLDVAAASRFVTAALSPPAAPPG
jgi:hypothetical protein